MRIWLAMYMCLYMHKHVCGSGLVKREEGSGITGQDT